ncbi:hypothetical protein Tco_0982576 [Tanacetum coccineum]
MVSTTKDPLTFDDLMANPINFSKYVLNQLKINNLTQDILLGPAYNLLKGACSSNTELEYHFQECFNALTDRLDWNNPEGDRYPFDLSKPLPLQGHPGHLIVAADYFFNNDLEYLKSFDPKRTLKLQDIMQALIERRSQADSTTRKGHSCAGGDGRRGRKVSFYDDDNDDVEKDDDDDKDDKDDDADDEGDDPKHDAEKSAEEEGDAKKAAGSSSQVKEAIYEMQNVSSMMVFTYNRKSQPPPHIPSPPFSKAKEPIEEPNTEMVMDDVGADVVSDDDQPQDASKPKTDKTPEWFKQPTRPPTPDP